MSNSLVEVDTSPNISPATMMQLLAALSRAMASQVVRDLLAGNAAVPPPDGSTLVDQTLFCSQCQEMTIARMRLDSWTEFDKSFKQRKFTCQCGGVLLAIISH